MWGLNLDIKCVSYCKLLFKKSIKATYLVFTFQEAECPLQTYSTGSLGEPPVCLFLSEENDNVTWNKFVSFFKTLSIF